MVIADRRDQVEAEALARSVVNKFEGYVKLNKKVSPEVVGVVQQMKITRSLPRRWLHTSP